MPRRLLNYGGLIDPIADRLVADPAAGTKALKAVQFGRWLWVHEKFDVYFAASLTLWGSHGITPLWCMCRIPEDEAHRLQERFDGAQVEEGGRLDLCIPIRLAAGVERGPSYRRCRAADAHAHGRVEVCAVRLRVGRPLAVRLPPAGRPGGTS